jgi:hypothetical protein
MSTKNPDSKGSLDQEVISQDPQLMEKLVDCPDEDAHTGHNSISEDYPSVQVWQEERIEKILAKIREGSVLLKNRPFFNDNTTFVMAFVEVDGLQLLHASPRLQNHLDTALAAVNNNILAIFYVGADVLEQVFEKNPEAKTIYIKFKDLAERFDQNVLLSNREALKAQLDKWEKDIHKQKDELDPTKEDLEPDENPDQ